MLAAVLGPYVLAALLGYALGSIPTGYLVGRLKGVDIREHGSGNIGATNVVRVLGRGPGFFVFFCDALKGWLAVFIGRTSVGLINAAQSIWRDGPDPVSVLSGFPPGKFLTSNATIFAGVIAAIFCILGHNFPVWLRFKGGKGIATSAGVLLGLMPLAVLVSALAWALAFFTLRYVSVASMFAAAALPVTVGVLWKLGRADGALFLFSLLAAALAIWRHRTNIQRLLAGTEPRFQKKKTPAV